MSTIYGMNEIIDAAQSFDPENPHRRTVTLALRPGETAPIPGTSKRVFQGPGTIEYIVSPEQVTANPTKNIGVVGVRR